MTLEELFSLPDGKYAAELEDLSVYSYVIEIESNVTFSTGTYKKWVEIKLSSPERLSDIVYITKSDTDYILFSTESVNGLTISCHGVPSWFEYFKLKE